MSEIKVRAFEPSDTEAVAAIMSCPRVIAGTLQLPFRSIEERRQRFSQHSPDVHRLVAELDRNMVGNISLHLQTNPRRRHCGGLGMAVHDDFQGRGVGSALMAAVIELADNWLGLRRLELEVYTDNAPAIHLYRKFGFEIEGTLREFAFRQGEYADVYLMARLHP